MDFMHPVVRGFAHGWPIRGRCIHHRWHRADNYSGHIRCLPSLQLLALSIILAQVGFFAASLHTARAAEPSGLLRPLPVHNLYPPMLRFYEPLPVSAFEPYRRSLSIEILQSYSSIFQYDSQPNGSLLADMEIYSLEFLLTKAISSQTEIRFMIPLYYSHEGFMDAFLRDYHDALRLPNSGRERRPDDEFSYLYENPADSESWADQAGWDIGKLAVSLRQQVYEGDNWTAALLAGLTLPTASSANGWSSGEPDIAIGGVASWLKENWFGHLEGHFVHPFANGSEITAYDDYVRLSTTLGYRFGSRWSLLAQLQGGTSAYDSNIKQLYEDPWLVTFGARMAFGKSSSITVAFTEGITQHTSADFSLTIGLDFHPFIKSLE